MSPAAEPSLMPIAIVGMSCRLSGDVESLTDFWTLLSRRRDGWGSLPSDRVSAHVYHHPNPQKAGCFNQEGGYFTKRDLTRFDATFFKISEQEALAMDPQQRQLLECTFEALENGGTPMDSIAGHKMGVFVGGASSDYGIQAQRDLSQTPLFLSTGNHQSILAGRIAYHFDLRGPCLSIDTACSSSLTALHQAVQSIRLDECTSAIVAASALHLTPDNTVAMSMLGLFNSTGRTYAFDHRADSGFARGEGTGCLVLKPLNEALKANDKIYSVIVNTGTNQDGRTLGITLPNGDAQEELIRDVYTRAGVSPSDAGFIEAHGTGTKIGDPVEAAALGRVFQEGRSKLLPLHVGSVKTNIGHLENASGVISIIKASLMLDKGFILPNANFERLNEAIDFEQRHFRVPTKVQPWPKKKRFVSVNNFGFGGSNAHAILERAPDTPSGKDLGAYFSGPKLFVLSANDLEAAGRLAKNIGIYVEQHPEVFQKRIFMDMVYTLCERRTHLPWRFAVVAASTNELAQALNTTTIPMRASKIPKVAFCYSGQGAQWAGMGKELINSHPVFADSITTAAKCLDRLGANFNLLEELAKDESDSEINTARIAQPACTAVQIGLTDLLRSWGVRPIATIGHSSGEIAAAYATGAITLEAAMTIAYYRGLVASRMMVNYSSICGSMLAVGESAFEVKRLIEMLKLENVVVACENSPTSVTASGDQISIEKLATELDRLGVFNRMLRVEVAYHSKHMELVADEYTVALENISARHTLQTTFYSSLLGSKLNNTAALDSCYWVENLTKPVLFSTAFEELCLETQPDMVVELGPHAALQGPIKQILSGSGGQIATDVKYLSMLVRGQDASFTTLTAAGKLFVQGQKLDFAAVNQTRNGEQHPKVLTDFASYPWTTHRYWFDSRISKQHLSKPFARHDLLGALADAYSDAEPTWTNVLSVEDIPWLRDHRMQSLVTFPFAGYLCMAVEAVFQRARMRGVLPDHIAGFRLREVTVSKALLLDSETQCETMVSMRAFSEGTRSTSTEWDEFSVSSWTSSRGWLEHCRGLIGIKRQTAPNPISQTHSVSAVGRRDSGASLVAPISTEEFYNELSAQGAQYAGPFTLPMDANLRGSKSYSDCTILVPETAKTMPMCHETPSILPTAFMDLFFQLTFVILGAGRAGLSKLFMPTAIKEAEISMPLPSQAGEIFHASARTDSDRSASGSVDFNIDGWHEQLPEPALKITGFRMTPVNNTVEANSAPRNLCYKLQWEAFNDENIASCTGDRLFSLATVDDALSSATTPSLASDVIVITERPITDALVTATMNLVQLYTGTLPRVSSLAAVEVSPTTRYLCLSELDDTLLFDMPKAVFVHVQRLLLGCRSILWLTRGAYRFCEAPQKNLIQGLLRTIRSESRAAAFTLDLDPSSMLQSAEQAALIWSVFKTSLQATRNHDPSDFEFAEEDGKLVVPRIMDAEASNVDISRATQSSAPYEQDWPNTTRRLKPVIGTYGALDSIYWDDDADEPLGTDEIEIDIAATGMNFKDVVITMGKVASPYLGVECSGTVVKVGSAVSALSIGDRVCAMSLGAYSRYTRCRYTSAAKIPGDMTFEKAASIPVVFCTAYYAIVVLAHLRAGESILIHAGSGGVGQAAVQIAKMIGAKVYTTVGSVEKRDLLIEEYGIPSDCIFYSRDTTFGSAVRQATIGRGVDVVINSLAGDLLRETWECLAPFGRFVEIGKRDIVANTRLEMAKFEYNCSFSSVDLTLVAAKRPELMSYALSKVMDLLAEGVIKPVEPLNVVGISQIETALRKLQSGIAPGKTVVSHTCKEQVRATHPNASIPSLLTAATYVIVGGTGGLGRSVAKTMVQRGAKHIVLLSRRGILTSELQRLIDESRNSDACIHVKACDVGDALQVKDLSSELHHTLPPICGVVHAAMVLRDTLFENMSYEDYETVVHSKTRGAWNLVSALAGHSLDFFIMLSSVAGIVGNKGQAAYAAANTFLDALARYCRRRGMPATSLDLSAVDDVGYLAENAEQRAKVANTLSATTMSEAEVLYLVDVAMSNKLEASCSEQCIIGLDFSNSAKMPFYADDAKFSRLRDAALAQSSNTNSSGDEPSASSMWQRLQQAGCEEAAREVVKAGLRDKLSIVLMVPTETIEARQGSTSISALGLDSLNAIEVRNWIGKELQAHLQVLELLSGGGLDDLAGLILRKAGLLKDGVFTIS